MVSIDLPARHPPDPGAPAPSLPAQDEPPRDPFGPLTRGFLRTVWTRLFKDEPSNALYLPRIVKDGYPPLRLPSYDPANPGGVSDPVSVPGVPQEVADAACTADVPISPIATAAPALSLLNIRFTNLSAMSPVRLEFSDSEPILTATVRVGTEERPFTLAAAAAEHPNFLFQVPCCEPVDVGSRDCSERRWRADAEGHFVATAVDAEAAATIHVSLEHGKPVSVQIVSIGVTADPRNMQVDFDVTGLPEWAQQMAQIAINEGVGDGSLVQSLQIFLNSADVKQHLEELINDALKKIGDEEPGE